MKKTICLLVCSLFALSGFAQLQDWKLSVNAAPSIGWGAASGDIKSDGSRFAFDLSIHAERYFKERYAFYTGIAFMKMGGRFQNISTSAIALKSDNLVLGTGVSTKYSLQYLNIPIGIKLTTPELGALSYYFQGGLLPGIRVGNSIIMPNADKHSFGKDLNLMTCATQISLGCMYSIVEDTFLRAGLVFNYFFVDAMSAKNMKILPSSLGIQIGFLF